MINREIPRLITGSGELGIVWQWLLLRGPHGRCFGWERKGPGTYRAIEHLREIVVRWAEEEPEFPEKARQVAREAIEHEDSDIVRRGIQVLSVVGSDADLVAVSVL